MTDRKEKAMLAVLEQGELICVEWATLMAIQQLSGVVPSASDLAWPFELSKGRSREEKLHSDRLRKCSAKTLKTLSSTINSLFKKPLSESEVSAIIAELTKRGIVVVNKTKISYALPVGS